MAVIAAAHILVTLYCGLCLMTFSESAPAGNSSTVQPGNNSLAASSIAGTPITNTSGVPGTNTGQGGKTPGIVTPPATVAPVVKPYVAASVLKNCTLSPESKEIVFRVKKLVDEGARLIQYNLRLTGSLDTMTGLQTGDMYKPFVWVRTTGRHGRGLLLLRHDYDVLSLTTLRLGVESLDVNLIQSPSNCLRRLHATDVERLIRELVMNDFQNTSSGEIVQLGEEDDVCNMHIGDVDGVADFYYNCCERRKDISIVCTRLSRDTWLNVLFFVIAFLKVLVILYSPRLVPDSWYRESLISAPYLHPAKGNPIQADGKQSPKRFTDPVKMNVVITKSPDRYTSCKTMFKLSKFRDMAEFKKTLQTMLPDVIYNITMEDIRMRIKANRLMPPDYAPVGLMKALYDTFIRCKVRDRSSVKQCCYSDVCGPSSPCSRPFPWFRLLMLFMQLLAVVTLALPWVLRVYIYFRYEDDEMTLQKASAKSHNLRFSFPGNFTLYLTPLHVLFIIIYVLLSIESCLFGMLRKKVKERFKLVLRKSFRDMREGKKMDVLAWAVSLALKPCTKHGLYGVGLGFALWVLGSPIMLSILASYFLPTLNITLRLLAHFIVYLIPSESTCSRICGGRFRGCLDALEKKFEIEAISSEESLVRDGKILDSGKGRFQQLLVITLCLISMYSIIFLITEMVSFFVELILYTMMGVILNASVTLTYLSLVIMLVVYGGDCFGHVSKKYYAFNSTINGYILGLAKDKVEDVIYNPVETQMNYAFRVKTERQEIHHKPVELVKSCEGYPRWQVTRLLMFFCKSDTPYIPRRFYFNACKMPFFACPGELLLSYLRASVEFGVIIVFLMFVLIVVLAFGDSYEISATNQLLATVAGGFLPLMLRKVLFKARAVPTIDTTSINFQVAFNDLLDNFTQTWPVQDVAVKKITAIEAKTADESISDITPISPTDMEPESPVFRDEAEPFVDTSVITNAVAKKVVTPIDLLVDIREIDLHDFPAMHPPRDFDIGSTSLLEDIEETLELENPVDVHRLPPQVT